MADLIGRQLGQYLITALLGQGGMATVYRAHQSSFRRDVAIKVIERKLAQDPEFIERFRREAETIGALDHPHILKVFDFGEVDGQLYLVMELKTGSGLAQKLGRGPLTPSEAAKYLDQIAGALDYAHARGIVHRDLKPQNVLLDSSGNAFLTDFGIAKVLDGSTSLTQSGAVMGTPNYMPPEQWQSLPLDARTDEYALTIMLFEMLTGRMPFKGDTPFALMYAHMNSTPFPARDFRADLPEAVERVIAKGLAKQPEDRFQSAGELAEAFRAALSGVAESKPRDSRRWIVLGGLALMVLAIIAVVLIGRNGGAPAISTTVAPLVAANPTETPPGVTLTATVTPTFTASATDTLTATPSIVPTATPFDVFGSATAIMMQLTIISYTATPTASNTPDVIGTANAQASSIYATVTESAAETFTATQWTQTPTPVFTFTASDTATITPTATLTSTLTNTPTLTTTFTPTPTVTSTLTATLTPTPTFTITPSQTPSNTPTLTETPIETATSVVTPTTTPIPAGTSNSIWRPIEQTLDGLPMVLVPAGCFTMGSDTGADDEKPASEVCFDSSFWIGKTEVSQALFKQLNGRAANATNNADSQRPVEKITWEEAQIFCINHGGRLPSEAEWEYAARGPEDWLYPWGNDFVAANVVYASNSGSRTADVGSKPSGASWVGALDMSGNVWEWTNSLYFPYPYKASDGREFNPGPTYREGKTVLRGGSYSRNQSLLRASRRAWFTDFNRNGFDSNFATIGFRCARTVKTGDWTSKSMPVPSATPSSVGTATPTLIPAGTSNTVWQPVEQAFNGVKMELVPAGCFNMGSNEGNENEKPIHEQCFDKPFWIDKTEVTEAQFKKLAGKAANLSRFGQGQRPVTLMGWNEARDFCALRDARLPTEAEWEYAARGPEDFVYPWGNTFIADNVVYVGNSKDLASVGSKPRGASWVGALDLSGNAWEWMSSLFQPYPYVAEDGRENVVDTSKERELRGGSWSSPENYLRASTRIGDQPGDGGSTNISFRCARDYN